MTVPIRFSVDYYLSVLFPFLLLLTHPALTLASPYATASGYIFDSAVNVPTLQVNGALRIGINGMDVSSEINLLKSLYNDLNNRMSTFRINTTEGQLLSTVADLRIQLEAARGNITELREIISIQKEQIDMQELQLKNINITTLNVRDQIQQATGNITDLRGIVGIQQGRIDTQTIQLNNVNVTALNGIALVTAITPAVKANTDAINLQGASPLMATINYTLNTIQSSIIANKNRIINGLFSIDTANNGALVSPAADGTIVADNWRIAYSYAGGGAYSTAFAIQRNMGNVFPAGVTSYIGIKAINSVSQVGGYSVLLQYIYWGQILDLAWGTSNALPLTLSFQVRVRIPGIYGGSIRNLALSRSLPFSFTVTSADAWTPVSVVIPPDPVCVWTQPSPSNIAGSLLFSLIAGISVAPANWAFNWLDGDYHTVVSQTNFAQITDGYYFLTAVQLFSPTAAFEYRPVSESTISRLSASIDSLTQSTPAFRNRLQNGGMLLDTIHSGAAVTANHNTWIADWWFIYASIAGGQTPNILQSQMNMGNLGAPAGLSSYCGVKSIGTVTNPLSHDYLLFMQRIPYGAVMDLAFGNNTAVSITLSFWFRSNIAGAQFGGSLLSASSTRSFPFLFTVITANVWQFVSFNVPGDVVCCWNRPALSSPGLSVLFTLLAGDAYVAPGSQAFRWGPGNNVSVVGQTNFFSAVDNYFHITGIQLERGSVANAFDTRPYDTELVPAGTIASTITSTKNRITNGLFALDSYNNGALISPVSAFTSYAVNDWVFQYSGPYSTSFAMQRNLGNLPPLGFDSYFGIKNLNTIIPNTPDYAVLVQLLTSGVMADLYWGTSNALPIILSFQVRIKQAGTYGGSIRNLLGSCSFPFTFLVTSDTWTSITIRVPGATCGTWVGTTPFDPAVQILFALFSTIALTSSVNVWNAADYWTTSSQANFATTANNYYLITAVQIFSTSASFDYRPTIDVM
jgi:TolA-binding protein